MKAYELMNEMFDEDISYEERVLEYLGFRLWQEFEIDVDVEFLKDALIEGSDMLEQELSEEEAMNRRISFLVNVLIPMVDDME